MRSAADDPLQLDLFDVTDDIWDIGIDITRTDEVYDVESYCFATPGKWAPKITIHLARINQDWTWSTECKGTTSGWFSYPAAKWGPRASSRQAAFRGALKEKEARIDEGMRNWGVVADYYVHDYKSRLKLLAQAKAHVLAQP